MAGRAAGPAALAAAGPAAGGGAAGVAEAGGGAGWGAGRAIAASAGAAAPAGAAGVPGGVGQSGARPWAAGAWSGYSASRASMVRAVCPRVVGAEAVASLRVTSSRAAWPEVSAVLASPTALPRSPRACTASAGGRGLRPVASAWPGRAASPGWATASGRAPDTRLAWAAMVVPSTASSRCTSTVLRAGGPMLIVAGPPGPGCRAPSCGGRLRAVRGQQRLLPLHAAQQIAQARHLRNRQVAGGGIIVQDAHQQVVLGFTAGMVQRRHRIDNAQSLDQFAIALAAVQHRAPVARPGGGVHLVGQVGDFPVNVQDGGVPQGGRHKFLARWAIRRLWAYRKRSGRRGAGGRVVGGLPGLRQLGQQAVGRIEAGAVGLQVGQ